MTDHAELNSPSSFSLTRSLGYVDRSKENTKRLRRDGGEERGREGMRRRRTDDGYSGS